MATNNRITYTLDFKANFRDVQGQLNTLRQSLTSVATAGIGANIAPDIQKASQAAIALQGHLKRALDPSTGRLDLSRLQTQLSASGQSAKTLGANLLQGGQQGAQAFLQLSNAILNAQKPMHRFSELSHSLWTTLKNTARWQISSAALNAVTSSLSNAVRFATDLDTSLNKIRIVSGASREEMERFAVYANKAAKNLSASTKAFTDATLIYRQQGDTSAEAARKAEITLKAANAAGVEAQEMSEYLTGIWNSYQVGAEQLELFADKIVKVGAVTASSTEEMSTAMTKVAATANSVGVTYDQLLSTIATVTSATRLSSEQVGTAFKTIYARMGDLKLEGSIDEDGVTTTLGSVSSQLKQVGVNVLDANGNLRDMGLVVEDLGNKWSSLGSNQRTAIAEAVAGKRQYTQLFALFDNWDEYSRTLKEAANAQGELNKQQSIYEDSVKGAQQRFKAAKEDFLLDAGFGGETIQLFLDGATTMMEMLDGITEAAGGIGPILMLIGSIAARKMAPQVAQSLVDIKAGFLSTFGLGESKVEKMRNEMHELFTEARSNKGLEDFVSQRTLDAMETLNTAQQELEMRGKEMTAQERERYKILVDMTKLKYEQAFTPAANQLANTQNTIQSFEKNIPSDQRTFRAGVFDDTNVDKTVSVGAMDIARVTNRNAQNAIAQIRDIASTAEGGVVPLRTFVEVLNQTGTVNDTTGLRQIISAMTQTGNASDQLVSEFREYIDALTRVEFEEEKLQDITNSLTGAFQKLDTSVANSKLSSAKEFLLSGEGKGKKAFRQKYFNVLENDSSSSKDLEKGLEKVEKEQTYYKQKIAKKEAGGFDITENERKAVAAREEVIKAYKDEIAVTKEYEKSKYAEKGVSKATYKETQTNLNTLKEHAKSLDNTTAKLQTFSSVAGATGQSVMGVAMAMSAWKSMTAEGATWTDRIMGGAMLLTSVLSTLHGVMSIGNGLMSSKLVLEKLTQIAEKKGIAVTTADTAAQMANNTAKAIAKAMWGDLSGLILLGTVATIGATAAIVANTKATDKGAESAKKYAEAQKQIEEVSEEKSKIQEKIDSYEKLSKQLEDAANSATDLTKIQQELRKELGVEIDLVNGGAEAQARANAILKNNIELEKERLALKNEELAKGYRTQLNNIDVSSVNRWFSTPSKLTLADLDKVIQQYNQMSDEMQEKFSRGELGTQTFDVVTAGWFEEFDSATITSGIQQVKDSFANVLEGLKETAASDMMPHLSTLGNSLIEAGAGESLDNLLAIYEKNTEKIKTYFANKDEEGLKAFIGTMMPDEFTSEEEREAWRKFEEDQVANIITAKNDYQKAVYETPLAILSDSFKGLRDLTEATSDLLSDFAKNGELNTEKIAEFVKKLGGTETEVKKIQEELLKANSEEEVGKVLAGITLEKIITNNDLKALITQEGGLAQVEKIFSENNIRNAKELATQIYNNVKAAEELNEKYEDSALVQILKEKPHLMVYEWSASLEQLQTEYGFTEEAAHSLLLQEAVFNNEGLNVSARINALKDYINIMGLTETALGTLVASSGFANLNVKNLSDEDKTLFGINDKMTDDEVRLQIAKVTNEAQNQDSYRIDLSNKKAKEEAEALKDYTESLNEWTKENDIAKITDDIERLNDVLSKLSNILSNKEFAINLYGEDAVPLEYYTDQLPILQKQLETAKAQFQEIANKDSQYYEGSQEYLDALNERRQNYQDAVLKIEEIEQRIKEIKRDDEDFEQEELDLIDEAARSALEGISSLVTTIYDTVDKVLSASKELMELYDDNSITARQGAAAKLIGSMIGGNASYSEEQKERAKSKKELKRKIEDFEEEKENHLRIKKEEFEEIIEEDKKMMDTISDYSSEVMEQGIAERQADRNEELQEIKDDYAETITHISSTINSALTMTEEKINSVLKRARELAKLIISDNNSFTANSANLSGNNYTSDSPSDFYFQGDKVSPGASKFYVTNVDQDKGTITIQSVSDVFGEEIPLKTITYDIWGKQSTGDLKGSISSNILEQWNKNGGNKFEINSIEQIGTQVSDIWEKSSQGIIHSGASTNSTKNDFVDLLDPKIKKQLGLAKGSNSTPAGEAFVGEEGRELILLPDGSIVLAGQDGIELANLPAGAKVLTNEETEKIFKNKKDYANLVSSLTSESGKKVSYDSYADGSGEIPILETEDLTQEFHDKELKEQEEQNKKITESLKKRNEEINKNEEKYHSTSLQNTESHQSKVLSKTVAHEGRILSNANTTNTALTTGASLTASAVEGFINNMKFVLPRVDSEEFLDSLDKAIKDAIELAKAEREENGDIKSSQATSSSAPGPGGKEYDFISKYGGTGILKKSGTHNVRIGQGNTSYDDLFVKYGQKYGVPPELLKTIAAGESGFTPSIDNISGSGAQGMMQFMPSTSRLYGIKNPYDPDEAVEGAAKALSANYQKTNSWYKTLNMYGQGSYNKKHQYLDKIIDALGDFDRAQVEDIEFAGSSFSDLLTKIATEGIESIVKIPSSLDGDLTKTQITELSQNGWIDPVLGKFPVTDEFGRWRNGSKGPYQHGGIDIGAPQGTPLYATKSGVVVINQNDVGGYGHWIKIKTDDGYIIGYGHMREASPYKVGTRVSQGQVIGYVGSTGRSFGPHLDYHVLSPEGSSINPRSIMPGYARGGKVTSDEKALVGEYGKEIILYPDGTAGLLGVNGMEYADLPAGAQIIPNEETEKILNNPVDYKNSSNKLNAHALGSGIYSDKEIEMAWKVLEGMAKHNSSPEALANWTLNPYNDADQKPLMALAGYENNDAQFYALSVSYMRELQKLPTATLNYLQSMVQEKYPGMSTGMPGEVNSELIHSLMAIQEANNYESIVHPLIEFFGEDYVSAMKSLEKLKSTDYSARKYEDEYKTKLNTWMLDNFGQEKIAEAIELFSDPTNPNFFLESSRIAAENNQKIVEFAQGELDSLIAEYRAYQAQVALTGEKNEAFEAYISEAITKAGNALTQAAEEAKQYAETLHNVREEELEHIKNLDTAMGRYNATVEATIAKKRLDNLLLYEPEDIEEIYQAQTEYQAALLAELQAQLDVINRYYEDKIEDTEKKVQRLTGYLNITQSYYDEFNSYEEGLHEINKQLTESKIKTEWFDKKTKEMLFNEKDYLAISTKIFELQQDALDDREATEELIENLSEDELYMTESINAAYKERVEMRKKELDLLKTTITLQDKQAALNDALMNRNVRVFSGGRWIQIANVETVSQAQRDFEETKYQISKKQAEMEQLEDINTQNENIRELNDNIKEWQETMRLAAKYLEDAEIGLTEQVSLSGTSLESFREAVDTTVTEVINARDKIANLGYDNYDKNSIKSQLEILAEELYDAKVLYEDAKDDATRNLASQDAARIRQKAYDLTGNKDALSWGSEYNASQFLASQGKTIADLMKEVSSLKSSSKTTSIKVSGPNKVLQTGNGVTVEVAVDMEPKSWVGAPSGTVIRDSKGNFNPNYYATGTRDSKPGLSWINEKGVEMLSTPYGQLIELSPHQKIFNNEQLNYLYDMSKQGLQGMTAGLSSISNNSNSITISDLNIALDNVTDAESFVTELQGLTRYIRNVKTIKRNS